MLVYSCIRLLKIESVSYQSTNNLWGGAVVKKFQCYNSFLISRLFVIALVFIITISLIIICYLNFDIIRDALHLLKKNFRQMIKWIVEVGGDMMI